MKIMSTRMSHIIAFLLVTACQSLVAESTDMQCYSTYHLEQNLTLDVKLNQVVEKQNITMDINIHVREIAINTAINNRDKIRAYVMLVRPNHSKVNGIVKDLAERYEHPFLIYVNSDTGEVVDLKSTIDEQSIINEYLSFFDLFQYTNHSGSYQYRNGNGLYLADIQALNKGEGKITKINSGYLSNDNKLEVKNSQQSIVLDNSLVECFYLSSELSESFRTTLSKHTYVEGLSRATVVLDKKLSLQEEHFFFTLTDQLDSWPSFEALENLSYEQAVFKIDELMETLSSLVENKSQFLSAMRTDKAVWPFLADYLLENNLDETLSNKIFWALDRINTSQSVSALARMSVSDLEGQLSYRSIMALSSTSAPLDSESFELVQNYLFAISESEYNSQESLLLVRVLGSLVKRQNANFPVQSNDLKLLLYSQVDSVSNQFSASVIDAIGNLRNSIDEEGVSILINGLDSDSAIVKQSSLQALAKIPYNEDFSELYVAELVSENNAETKESIIELLGNSPKTDEVVKLQLLSIVSQSRDLTHRKKSLSSLRKINYHFQKEDVDVLKFQLRQESDKTNQKLLAALILKSRRQ